MKLFSNIIFDLSFLLLKFLRKKSVLANKKNWKKNTAVKKWKKILKYVIFSFLLKFLFHIPASSIFFLSLNSKLLKNESLQWIMIQNCPYSHEK